MKYRMKRIGILTVISLALLFALTSFFAQRTYAEPGSASSTQNAGSDRPSFCLCAVTSQRTVIAPVRIFYEEDMTVEEALQASSYEFTRYGAFIEEIEGIYAGYLIYMDEGKYDLSVPASSVTAVLFSENEDASDASLSLLKEMVSCTETAGNAIRDPDVRKAYDNGLASLQYRKPADTDEARKALVSAIEAYEARLNGEKYTVSAHVSQDGQTFARPVITLTDAYGNITTNAENADISAVRVVAGEYSFSISDGKWNRTEGKMTVSGDASIDVTLPSGEWFGTVRLLGQSREPFEAEYDAEARKGTFYVPDQVGRTGVILNAGIGNVPDRNTTKLYGCYTGVNGEGYSNTARTWESTAANLTNLVKPGMGGAVFSLEARYVTAEGTTQIQSYAMEVRRVPTLSSLTVLADGAAVPIAFDEESGLDAGFDPYRDSYTVSVTADSAVIEAEPFAAGGEQDEPYEVTGTGNYSLSGETAADVTVSASGQSKIYHILIRKVEAAEVRFTLPAGTSVQVYNAAGSGIGMENGICHLVPGEQYRYIATRGGKYHAEGSFTAADGLTVRAAEPLAEDPLTEIAFYNASSKTTRKQYIPEKSFSPSGSEISIVIPDTASVLYAQATALDGYTVNASYLKQTRSAASHGVPQTSQIRFEVGAANNAGVLTGAVGDSGFGQVLTVRASKELSGVTYYREYTVRIRKELHLRTLTVYEITDGTAAASQLTDEAGNAVAYDRDRKNYRVYIDRSVQELSVSGEFINPGGETPACGGYSAEVNGEIREVLESVPISLFQEADEETVTIRVLHEDEDAVESTYTVTAVKSDPVYLSFRTEPEDAAVFLLSERTGSRVMPAGDAHTFPVVPGFSYSYTVTAPGFIGSKTEEFMAPSESMEIAAVLEAAPESSHEATYAFWPSSRYDAANNAAVSVKTPVKAEDTVLYWASKVGEGYSKDACGCPILAGGYLYTYAGDSIYKIDTVSGEILAQKPMDHSSSFAINAPTYAEGMIFVGLSDGTVQAFDAVTLDPVWIYHDEKMGQPNCPIIYKDGCIYTGFWLGETSRANYVCLTVTDEDPASPSEEKLPSWTYTSKGGFYWAGAYVSDNYLLIGTDDGEAGYMKGRARLLSLDPRSGVCIDELQMPFTGDIRCGITFSENGSGGGRGYFTSKGGTFSRVDVTADGTFAEGSLKTIALSNGTQTAGSPAMSCSTPTIRNGRAYVGVSGTNQFGPYSGHNITVIDLDAFRIAYSVPTQGYPQTSGILTTAYEEETGCVYVYFFDNYTPGKLRVLEDKPGQTEPSVTTEETYTDGGTTKTYETASVLFTPYAEHAQYALCSAIADASGTLYFKNDSAYLMAVGPAVQKLSITEKPDKMRYEAGETFDPAGMKVTALFSNGLTKDVTDYAVWSEEPLTEDDRSFQIYYPYALYHDENGAAGVKAEEPFAVLRLLFGDDEDIPDLEEISITETEIEIAATQSGRPTVKAVPEKAELPELIWKSSDPKVASVDENGNIMGHKVGNAVITASTEDGTISASVPVRVLFSDVTDKSKANFNAIYSLVEKGVIAGFKGGEYFAPNDECTRGQVVLFLWRAAGKPEPKSSALTFKDAAAIEKLGPQYKKAVLWGNEKGIVKGFTSGVNKGMFMPNDPCTRAQIVLFLYRYAGKPDVGDASMTFKDADEIRKMAPDYTKAILWAVGKKITTGYKVSGGYEFRPARTCTRGECATFLYRQIG